MAHRMLQVRLYRPEDRDLLVKILCYPKPCSDEVLADRLRQLQELDVDAVVSYGCQEVQGFNVLGKGCDSVVVKALVNDLAVALKIRRVDSHVKTLISEGESQALANTFGVGAKVYGFTRDFIVMELVEGLLIGDFVVKAEASELRDALRDLLEQCWRLDTAGLDHGELSRAYRHVLFSNGKPVILDFGSSSRRRRPSNVSSIFSFLFLTGSPLSRVVCEKLGVEAEREALIEALRTYKRLKTRSSFMDLLRAVKLIG